MGEDRPKTMTPNASENEQSPSEFPRNVTYSAFPSEFLQELDVDAETYVSPTAVRGFIPHDSTKSCIDGSDMARMLEYIQDAPREKLMVAAFKVFLERLETSKEDDIDDSQLSGSNTRLVWNNTYESKAARDDESYTHPRKGAYASVVPDSTSDTRTAPSRPQESISSNASKRPTAAKTRRLPSSKTVSVNTMPTENLHAINFAITDECTKLETKDKQPKNRFVAQRPTPAQSDSGRRTEQSAHVPKESERFLKHIQESVHFDHATRTLLNEDLKALHYSLSASVVELSLTLETMVPIKAAILCKRRQIECLEQEINKLGLKTDNMLEKDLQAKELIIEQHRTQTATKVILPLKTLWDRKCASSESLDEMKQKLDEKNTRINAVLSKEMIMSERMAHLEAKTIQVEAEVEKKIEDLKTSKRDLDKSFYGRVQKLGEARLSDEKARLAERLSNAEAASKQRAKMLAENGELLQTIIELKQEMTRLSSANGASQARYKSLKAEAEAVKEGCDQLTKDSTNLQMEIYDLREDIGRLTEERDELIKERRLAQDKRSAVQTEVAQPAALSTIALTATSRYRKELEHLDGLVAVWRKTLDMATSDLSRTQAKRAELNARIEAAERKLQQTQHSRAPPVSLNQVSAPSTISEIKAQPLDAGLKLFTGADFPPLSSQTLPSIEQIGPAAARLSRGSKEPLPALSTPAVRAPKSFAAAAAARKVIRVVEAPKTKASPTRAMLNSTTGSENVWEEVET
ncbi:Nn.00g102510.m01.CDS01 [Neocucurbitaria sp. VM-36]